MHELRLTRLLPWRLASKHQVNRLEAERIYLPGPDLLIAQHTVDIWSFVTIHSIFNQ